MICHIVFESEYSYRYFQLIRQNFPVQDHVFIIHGHGLILNNNYRYNNCDYTANFSESHITGLLDKANSIIISGLSNSSHMVNYFFQHSYLLQKTYWFVWGGDIYPLNYSDIFDILKRFNHNTLRQNIQEIKWVIKLAFLSSIKARSIPFITNIQQQQKKYLLNKIRGIISVCKGDYELIKKIYKTNAEYLYGFHPLVFDWDNLSHYIQLSANSHDLTSTKAKVLIGNSASRTNNHIEFLDALSKTNIMNYDVELYCPLSYGDLEYAETVIKKGKDYFGQNFTPLTKVLNPQEYNIFLSSINVAFMNHNRQEALGTINILILMGAKIYMRNNISSYYFYKNKGVIINDINNVFNNDFSQILYYSSTDKEYNRQTLIDLFSEDKWIEVWEKIFDILSLP